MTVLSLAVPAVASAQVMPDISGVDQYVEPLPTGEGNQPAGSGSGSAGPVDAEVEGQIAREGGSDAETLTAITSDARYGAPRDKIKDSKVDRGSRSRSAAPSDGETGASPPDVSLGDAISSGVGALASDEGDRGTTGLLIALAAVSLAIGGLAVWRSRRRSA